jgi:hypothetical protein
MDMKSQQQTIYVDMTSDIETEWLAHGWAFGTPKSKHKKPK